MRRAAALVIALATLAFVSTGVDPAAAGVACAGKPHKAPDGRVRVQGEPWIGIGEHPQTVLEVGALDEGESAVFKMRWANLTAEERWIRLKVWSSVLPTGFTARYLLQGVDVTDRLLERRVTVRDVAPGHSTPSLKLVVTNVSSNDPSAHVEQYVRGRYSVLRLCDELVAVME